MIPRLIEKPIHQALNTGHKIILLFGARQVGKTTVLNSLNIRLKNEGKKVIYLNCDLEEDLREINTTSLTVLSKSVGNAKYLFIDEAQHLDNPGLTLKIIHDQLPDIHVVATGSSSLDLKNKLSDPLTGRFLDFTLYPFSLSEVVPEKDKQANFLLSEFMIYGSYPEVYLEGSKTNKEVFLSKIIDSYLLKDILSFQKVRQPQVIKDLTRALSYQVSSEINENELSNRLKVDRKTIVSYLDLLEKTFVIIKVFPYSKNPRREIGRNYKIYFTDLGMRNALIGDFNQLELRSDLGALWENFLILERLKLYANRGETINYNFWRSYGGAEIDYLERQSSERQMQAFELKYAGNRISRGAVSFSKEYKLPVNLINRENYLEFIS